MKFPPIQYHDYLGLDSLLGSVTLRSEQFGKRAHEEHLFIIVHQAYELWFKQILHELDSILGLFQQKPMAEENVGLIVSRLERCVAIQKLINQQIDVLETMTPQDFLEFRDFLYPASGFQSFQWRMIETKFGLKNRVPFTDSPFFKSLLPDQSSRIQKALAEASLFDAVEEWLERLPLASTPVFEFWSSYESAVLGLLREDEKTIRENPRLGPPEKERSLAQIGMVRDQLRALSSEPEYRKLLDQGFFRLSLKALRSALFIQLYRDKPLFQQPHRLIQALMDLDEKQTEWRSRHAQMVHRMIGRKIGTGGSSGHDYLRATAEQHKVFGDFFSLSSFYISSSARPQLPAEIDRRLNFSLGEDLKSRSE